MTETAPWVPLSVAALRGSTQPELHTASDKITQRTLSRIAGYVATREALRAVVSRQPRAVEVRSATDVAAEAILEAVRAGDPVPDDLVAGAGIVPLTGATGPDRVEVVADAATVLSARVMDAALSRVRDQLVAELDALVAGSVDDVLTSTTGQLVELVERARNQPPWIHDAAEAIATRTTDRWAAQQDQIAEYLALRRTQATWFAIASGGMVISGRGDRPLHAIANAVDIFGPDLVTGAAQPSGWTPTAELSIPESWFSADGLLWLIEHEQAVPWAPTPQQFTQARLAAVTAAAQLRVGEEGAVQRVSLMTKAGTAWRRSS